MLGVGHATVEVLFVWFEILFSVGLQMTSVDAIFGSEIYVGCATKSLWDHRHATIYSVVCGFVFARMRLILFVKAFTSVGANVMNYTQLVRFWDCVKAFLLGILLLSWDRRYLGISR